MTSVSSTPKKPSLTANPGYILTSPYIKKDAVFKSDRTAAGEAIVSKVLVVGDSVIDDQGIERKAPCKVGDVIVHAYNNKDFEMDFTKYRFVHFVEIYGRLENATK